MREFALSLLLVAAPAALPAQQSPQWDQARHMLIVTSPMDSADVYRVVTHAFESEGLILEHGDTLRGRIVSTQRPSDSYGGATATMRYMALVHRLQGGGSEIWLGGLIHSPPQQGTGSAESFFRSRTDQQTTQRPQGDWFFLGPSGNSIEWLRLQRIGETISRAGY